MTMNCMAGVSSCSGDPIKDEIEKKFFGDETPPLPLILVCIHDAYSVQE
jgi:hypothetical protein